MISCDLAGWKKVFAFDHDPFREMAHQAIAINVQVFLISCYLLLLKKRHKHSKT